MTTSNATAAPPALLSFADVLRIPVMRRVSYAQVVSLFGDFLALFAVIAVVSFRMHGTAAQLTGLQIAYMLPIVFVGPIAGVFVDRWPLEPTLITSALVRAALALRDGVRQRGGSRLRERRRLRGVRREADQ